MCANEQALQGLFGTDERQERKQTTMMMIDEHNNQNVQLSNQNAYSWAIK